MTPELWTRCPKPSPHYRHGCVPYGAGDEADGWLVRVPFDEAAERMMKTTSEWAESGYWASALSDDDATSLLLAALGEGEP